MAEQREIRFLCTYTDGKNWIKKEFLLTELMNGDCFEVTSDQPLLKDYKMDKTYEWTGRSDKDGKDIYEQDIVKVISTGQTKVVFFNKCSFGVMIDKEVFAPIYWHHDLEVIGTTYENPELL